MANRVYFISGLGADSRAFRKLVFPPDFELVHLDWIPPKPNESLEDYAARLALKIDITSQFYLIGLSFGGMLAAEIAKKLNPAHTFLISSTPTFKELPWYYRVTGKLKLQKLVPVSLLKKGNGIGLKFLGAKTPDELQLLKQLVTDSDPYFIKWAMTCILTWKNRERPLNLTHIHGTADHILPIRFTLKPDFIIKRGGHFMVYANAREIQEIIYSNLKITN
ncbi:alpha/beta hydrolase [Pedobacter sp. PAMC26386]|nr:alpha/beta hydrolase [Pedobacter sp. PAMC26386]